MCLPLLQTHIIIYTRKILHNTTLYTTTHTHTPAHIFTLSRLCTWLRSIALNFYLDFSSFLRGCGGGAKRTHGALYVYADAYTHVFLFLLFLFTRKNIIHTVTQMFYSEKIEILKHLHSTRPQPNRSCMGEWICMHVCMCVCVFLLTICVLACALHWTAHLYIQSIPQWPGSVTFLYTHTHTHRSSQIWCNIRAAASFCQNPGSTIQLYVTVIDTTIRVWYVVVGLQYIFGAVARRARDGWRARLIFRTKPYKFLCVPSYIVS